MALVGWFELQGLVVNGAYLRIAELYWNTNDPRTLSFRVDAYASQEAYQEGYGAILSQPVQLELPLEDPQNERTALFNSVRELAYNTIKQLPNYEGSVDA